MRPSSNLISDNESRHIEFYSGELLYALWGKGLLEAAAKLSLKRGRICIYWGVQLMGTQKQTRSKLRKEIAGGVLMVEGSKYKPLWGH